MRLCPPRRNAFTVVEFENMEKTQATFASPSYNEVRTLGNKYAMFRIVAAEGPSQ
jgi:uncharacterized protein (DUF1330 family)